MPLTTDCRANLMNLPPRQTGQVLLQADHWDEGSGSSETKEFVVHQLGVILDGRSVLPSELPSLDVLFSHVTEVHVEGCFMFARLDLGAAGRRTYLGTQLHQCKAAGVVETHFHTASTHRSIP